MKKEIEITICNYRPIKSIRCLVCKKLIIHKPHSKKNKVEKRQKTCRSKECLRKYEEVKRNLKGSKKKKNKQQREKYKKDPETRKRKKDYNQRKDIKEKNKLYMRDYMRKRLGITKGRGRK